MNPITPRQFQTQTEPKHEKRDGLKKVLQQYFHPIEHKRVREIRAEHRKA